MDESAILMPMFRKQFENCRVEAGDVVAIVSDLRSRKDYAMAAIEASKEIGCDVFQIIIPQMGRGEVGNGGSIKLGGMLPIPEAVVKSLMNSTFILDLTLEGFIHTKERDVLLKSGIRILRAGGQPPDVLSRLMSWNNAKENKERIKKAAEIISSSKYMKIISEAGTDLTSKMSPSATFASYGYSDEPGRWDVWGQNMVSNYPLDTNGVLVIDPGDYNVTPFANYHISKVELVIKDNYVVEINGNGFDANLIRAHMASYHEKNAYAISHVGWGLNKNALWSNIATYDRSPDTKGVSGDEGRVFWGNFLFSTGPNHHVGRFTQCHYDIGMRNCTIEMDGKTVVENGNVLND
jgi:2,5-dihydroxypyridine 5,6-dioxygenase